MDGTGLVMLQCSGVRADELDYEETREGTVKAVTFRSEYRPCGGVAAEGICSAATGELLGQCWPSYWVLLIGECCVGFRWNILLFIIIFRQVLTCYPTDQVPNN